MPADWWPRLWPNLAAWAIVTLPAWAWHHFRLLRVLNARTDAQTTEIKAHLDGSDIAPAADAASLAHPPAPDPG
jgi:hypothetical protein